MSDNKRWCGSDEVGPLTFALRITGARGTTSAGTAHTATGGWAQRCSKRSRTPWFLPAYATRAVRYCPVLRPQTRLASLAPESARLADKYVNLDDGWAIGRHPNGTLIHDPELFPYGIKPVADYIHSKDMLFGICAQSIAFPLAIRTSV